MELSGRGKTGDFTQKGESCLQYRRGIFEKTKGGLVLTGGQGLKKKSDILRGAGAATDEEIPPEKTGGGSFQRAFLYDGGTTTKSGRERTIGAGKPVKNSILRGGWEKDQQKKEGSKKEREGNLHQLGNC